MKPIDSITNCKAAFDSLAEINANVDKLSSTPQITAEKANILDVAIGESRIQSACNDVLYANTFPKHVKHKIATYFKL